MTKFLLTLSVTVGSTEEWDQAWLALEPVFLGLAKIQGSTSLTSQDLDFDTLSDEANAEMLYKILAGSCPELDQGGRRQVVDALKNIILVK